MSKKTWKDHLLSSGVPLEYSVIRIFEELGIRNPGEYRYERKTPDGLSQVFSVDVYAKKTDPQRDLSVECLVECKYVPCRFRQGRRSSRTSGSASSTMRQGKITKQDEDRRLRIVDDEIEANRRALGELVDTPMPTYEEWQHPCARSRDSPRCRSMRNVGWSRPAFRESRVQDYRVVSLYLLTGDVVSPVPTPHAEADPTKCPSCLRAKTSPRETYCHDCTDGMAAEQVDQKARRSGRDRGRAERVHPRRANH